jgi:hypothetical protein
MQLRSLRLPLHMPAHHFRPTPRGAEGSTGPLGDMKAIPDYRRYMELASTLMARELRIEDLFSDRQ